MRHTAKIPGFSMEMTLEKRDGSEVDAHTLARVEFVEGVKVLGRMMVDKYGVSEENFYSWLIDLGHQSEALKDKE